MYKDKKEGCIKDKGEECMRIRRIRRKDKKEKKEGYKG